MAINKVEYVENGTTRTLIDLTSDTALSSDVATGKTFHLANGAQATGTGTIYPRIPIISGNSLFFNGDNLPLINNFDYTTGSLIDCQSMFSHCFIYDYASIDLSSWDVSNVTNMDNMFLNSNMLTSINLSGWDTSSIESGFYVGIYGMFSGCTSLTSLDLSSFNLSNSNIRCSEMFYDCSSLQTLDLSGLDASKLGNSYNMFYGCSSMQTAYCRSDADKTILDAIVAASGQSWTFTVKQ